MGEAVIKRGYAENLDAFTGILSLGKVYKHLKEQDEDEDILKDIENFLMREADKYKREFLTVRDFIEDPETDDYYRDDWAGDYMVIFLDFLAGGTDILEWYRDYETGTAYIGIWEMDETPFEISSEYIETVQETYISRNKMPYVMKQLIEPYVTATILPPFNFRDVEVKID